MPKDQSKSKHTIKACSQYNSTTPKPFLLKPAPRPSPSEMSFPAVAEAGKVYHCGLMFDCQYMWEVPQGLKKWSPQYEKWYKGKWRLQRRELAAGGNVAAGLSVKKETEAKMRSQREIRRRRRERADQIARERYEAALAITRLALQKAREEYRRKQMAEQVKFESEAAMAKEKRFLHQRVKQEKDEVGWVEGL